MKATEIKAIVEGINSSNELPIMEVEAFIASLDMGNFDRCDENITYLALKRSGAYKHIGIEKECEIAAETSADNADYISKIFAIVGR